jgi:alanine racemase
MPAQTTAARRAWVETDLAALGRNLEKIKDNLPNGVRYIAVVKADAYGHGVVSTVTHLLQCGVEHFCVANVHEGSVVRELGPGSEILVLGAVLPDEAHSLRDYKLTASLSTEAEADSLAALGTEKHPLPVHIKIDTGMGRMGVWHEHAPAFIQSVLAHPTLQLRGIYTHFSSADDDPKFTATQRNRFLQALAALPPALREPGQLLIHADNSAGLETFAAGGSFNAVRVGLLQYGLPPVKDSLLDRLQTEPVLSFHSRVGLVKTLPKGTTVSYNRTCTLKRETRIALVTAGYADGVPRSASNRAQMLIRGRRCPVLGRVTMDQTVVDATDLPEVNVGDFVTLIGRQGGDTITMREFCEWTGMIPWEVFCAITKRVQRTPKSLRE